MPGINLETSQLAIFNLFFVFDKNFLTIILRNVPAFVSRTKTANQKAALVVFTGLKVNHLPLTVGKSDWLYNSMTAS
jgi:hypothetical protein